ncbi:6-phosphogluconate dehydrogenase 2 [Fusarium oxysporum f. sp. phaseoli]
MVEKFADIIYGGIYSVYSGRMLSGEYWARSELYALADMVLKDIKHLLGLGQEANMELKNALTGLAYLQKAMKRSLGDQLMSAQSTVPFVRRMGLNLRIRIRYRW